MSFKPLFSLLFLLLSACVAPDSPQLLLRSGQVRVKEGETIYMLAKRYHTTPRQIMRANFLSSTHIEPGWVLTMPPKKFGESEREESLPVSESKQEFFDFKQGENDEKTDPSQDATDFSFKKEEEKTIAELPLVSAKKDDFLWPLKGPVLEPFGKASGARALGITIGGRLGEDVMAAQEGEVAYTGKDLSEYGLLILVRHPDQSVTVYGHLDASLVERGEHVDKGQAIGKVGNTGIPSLSPRLYFELRKAKSETDKKPKALNPLPYLSD